MLQQRRTYSDEETRKLGEELAAELELPGRRVQLVALSGELGSGKTALVRGICRYFRCETQVTSPTFTIVNEYSGSRKVIHCDLYRLSTLREMLEIGLDETFLGNDVVLIEWAEKALELLPAPRLEIAATHGDTASERRFSIQLFTKNDSSILVEPKQLQWSLS